ncbi:MAG: porin [Hyphomicrobiales bacterium]|nr:porin [Hyphomicrobiales bacterium]MCP5370476.1 porin [Hyphomicrobiales bacterium]
MALVSGTAAADEKLMIGVHGYHQQWLTYVQEDNDNAAVGTAKRTGIDVKSNSEIWFTGSKKLDNGITVGVDVQLESDQPAGGGQIDETYAWFSSDSLGKIIIGDENNAAYLLHVWPTNGGVSVASGDVINIAAFRKPAGVASYYNTALGTTNIRAGENDTSKLTYLTPKFFGFQAGVSWWPEGAGQTANASGSRITTMHDGFAIGANYSNNFNGIGLGISAGYLTMDSTGGPQGPFGATGRDSRLDQYNVGLMVSFAGFTVTGNYNAIDDGMMTSTTTFDSTSWSLAASYATGPYTVGIQYFSGEAEDSILVAADDEHDVLMISGGYQLGAGVRLVAGFYTFDDTDETNLAATSNDGWGLVLGTKISF